VIQKVGAQAKTQLREAIEQVLRAGVRPEPGHLDSLEHQTG
jgi:hypothetical protein